MKLKSQEQRPGTACSSNSSKIIKDLKYGMDSVNQNGIHQNASSMFQYQAIKKEKILKSKDETKDNQKE